MQKLLDRMPIVYMAYLLGMTAAMGAVGLLGYTFFAYNEALWFGVNIFIEGLLMTVCCMKRNAATKAARVVAQCLPLCAIVFLVVNDFLVTADVAVGVLVLHGILCFVSCFIVFAAHKTMKLVRVPYVIVNTALFLLLLPIWFFAAVFGGMGKDTIVRRAYSPSGMYSAAIVNSDQGALGGNTFVRVRDHASEINVVIGWFQKETEVYMGYWGEFETMRIEWADEDTLLINDKPYEME